MFRRRAATCFLLGLVSGLTADAAAQTPAAGTAKGFIRVNGKTLTLTHAVAVTGPDSFDASKEVKLVLVTPAPIAADALAKATSRQDVFGLVTAGAVVEVEPNGHTVFLRHEVLGDDRLNTHGEPSFQSTDSRVSGNVHTFMSGDEVSFGFKVRYEITFDAPITKRLPLARATAAAAPPARAPAAAPSAKAPAGPPPRQPGRPQTAGGPPEGAAAPRAVALDWNMLGPYASRSRTEAARLLAEPGSSTTVDEHFWDGITRREPQRLALALQAGADVKQTRAVTHYTPLVLMAERCDLKSDVDAQVAIADQLIGAGADLTGLDANKANALTLSAYDCPIGVVRALIKAGLPLNAVSGSGTTPLKTAIGAGRVDVVDALLDAGLDPRKEPYNASKLASGNKEIEAALKKRRK